MADPNLSSFIWSVADLLRGNYKQSEYGKVILPFTVLRRLDCALEATKVAVLAEKETREAAGLNPEPFLLRKSGQLFYNTSPLDLKKLMGDQVSSSWSSLRTPRCLLAKWSERNPRTGEPVQVAGRTKHTKAGEDFPGWRRRPALKSPAPHSMMLSNYAYINLGGC